MSLVRVPVQFNVCFQVSENGHNCKWSLLPRVGGREGGQYSVWQSLIELWSQARRKRRKESASRHWNGVPADSFFPAAFRVNVVRLVSSSTLEPAWYVPMAFGNLGATWDAPRVTCTWQLQQFALAASLEPLLRLQKGTKERGRERDGLLPLAASFQTLKFRGSLNNCHHCVEKANTEVLATRG